MGSKKFPVKEQEFILNAIAMVSPSEGVNQEELANRLKGVLIKIDREE